MTEYNYSRFRFLMLFMMLCVVLGLIALLFYSIV